MEKPFTISVSSERKEVTNFSCVLKIMSFFLQVLHLIFCLELIPFLLSFQKWVEHNLNQRNVTFLAYCGEMEHSSTPPDGVVLVILAAYLGRNITLVSHKGRWSSDENKPDIILGYLGDGLFVRTKVGKYISMFYILHHFTNAFAFPCNSKLHSYVIADKGDEEVELDDSDVLALFQDPTNDSGVKEEQDEPEEPNEDAESQVIGTITALRPEQIVVVTEKPINLNGQFYCVVTGCTNETFSSMQGLKYHLTNVHDKVLVYKCTGCQEVFPNARDRNNHQKTHTQKVIFCDYCTYSTKYQNDAQRHEKKCVENPDLKWRCTLCAKNRKFQSDESFCKHLKTTHKMKGDFVCVYCKSLFETQSALSSHKCPVKRKYHRR